MAGFGWLLAVFLAVAAAAGGEGDEANSMACQSPPPWTVDGEDLMAKHRSNASRFEALFSRYLEAGLRELSMVIINSKGPLSINNLQELKDRVDTIPVYQETHDEPVWDILDGGKDDVYVYDRCGRLAYYIPIPLSFLSKPYVEAAILNAYFNDPCGMCNEAVVEVTTDSSHTPMNVNSTEEEDFDLAANGTSSTETNVTVVPEKSNQHHKSRSHPGPHPNRYSHTRGNQTRHNHNHNHNHHRHNRNESRPHNHHHHGNRTHHHHHHHHDVHRLDNDNDDGNSTVEGNNGNVTTHEVSSNETITEEQNEESLANAGTAKLAQKTDEVSLKPTEVAVTEATVENKKRNNNRKQQRIPRGNTKGLSGKGRERNRTLDAPESRTKRQAVFEGANDCPVFNHTRCREWKPKFHLVKQCCHVTPNKQVTRLKSKKCTSLSASKCLKIMKFKECCKRHPHHNKGSGNDHPPHKPSANGRNNPSPADLNPCTGFNDHVCRTIFRLGFIRSDCCPKEMQHANYTPLLQPDMCQHFDMVLCSKLQVNGLNHRCCRNRVHKISLPEAALCQRTLNQTC